MCKRKTSNALQNDDNHGSSKYSRLDDEEKEKVKKIVHILDRFGVSNEAYYEFTQLEGHESMMSSSWWIFGNTFLSCK